MTTISRSILIFATTNGLIFVALGASGAHVLSKAMGAAGMGRIQTGLEHQVFHTLATLDPAVVVQRRISIWFYWSGVSLALDTALLSGSLYCLVLSHLHLWTPVTPAGGVSLLVDWALMLVGAIRLRRKGASYE